MFQHRHDGGSRHLPIAEKLGAGFELHNYLAIKWLRRFLPTDQPIPIGILESISGTPM